MSRHIYYQIKFDLDINKHWHYLLLGIAATLFFSTSAQAEEVSTKAVDLIPTNNQLIASEQKNFSLTQNVDAEDAAKLPASNYWYVGGSVGYGFPNDPTGKSPKLTLGVDSAFPKNIAVGYQWEEARAELELSYSSYDVNNLQSGNNSFPVSGKLGVTTVMVNGYWDIANGSKSRRYVGAGIGLGFPNTTDIKLNEATILSSDGSTTLALQVKAGVEYEIVKKGNVFLEFKYQNITGFSLKSSPKVDYDSLNSFGFNLGYRQGF